MNIYYKQSDITAPLSELMLSPWALEGDGTRAAGIQEALHLIQDMINGEVPEKMKIPAADVVEVVRCKDCKHRPYPTEPGKTYGLTIEAPDGRCPCYNEDDGWYSWVPDNKFFCFYGERKEAQE